jgi:hypothetical protein
MNLKEGVIDVRRASLVIAEMRRTGGGFVRQGEHDHFGGRCKKSLVKW